jgi:hypothetical protein
VITCCNPSYFSGLTLLIPRTKPGFFSPLSKWDEPHSAQKVQIKIPLQRNSTPMILTILNLTRLWELLWLLRWHRHVLFVLGESDDRSKSINCVQLRDQNMPKPVLKYKMPDVERYQIPGISICSLSPCHRSEQSDCSIPKLANYDPPRRLFWKIGTWNQQSLRSTKNPPRDFVPLIDPSSQDILTMAGKCSLKKMICPFKAPSILYRSCLVLSNVNFIFSIKKGDNHG